VQNDFDVTNLLKNLLSVVTEVAGSAIAVVMTPILQVAAVIEEKIIAPIQNKVTSAGLTLAIDQFCGMLPGLVAPLGFTLPSNSKDICIAAA
jgi:hypothetical protein